MGLYTRFGQAFGELGTHLKSSPFIKAWKKGGPLAAARRVGADIGDANINWASYHPAKDGLVRWDNPLMYAKHPALIGAVGGAAAGGGTAAYRNRDRHKTSVLAGIGAGAFLGALAGSAHVLGRHSGARNTFGNLRGAPGAFMKGWKT